jgi:dephospho-CoA kinase
LFVTGTRVIGLTGGIASGKSTVARILERLGAVIIDADILSREAVAPGEPALEAIVAEFGGRMLNPDRTLNRQALGQLVFADPEARRRLEAITHPAIARMAEQKLAACRKESVPVVFYVAPLLIEAGRTGLVDEIWVVYADEATQMVRLIQRDGISPDDARRRLTAQMPMEEKKKFGRVVIDNRGTVLELEQQVGKVWAREIEQAGMRDEG